MTTLQKKMKIIGSIHIRSWGLIPKLVSIMDSVTVVKSEWRDQFRRDNLDMFPLNLSEIKTWSTYSDCVSLYFKPLNTKVLECDVTIYDGDLNGNRKNIRFMAMLNIPISFSKELKDEINSEFDWYCERKYEEHLTKMKKDWIENFKETALF